MAVRWSAVQVVLAASLAACTHAPPAADPQAHVPPFARAPFEPFSRAAVIAIALREWRVFGEPVDDTPPDSRPEIPTANMPDHREGLWQRVGEYWWLGQDADRREASWTGKYDGRGDPIPEGREDAFAWSAAFVSYVMRMAGAGERFPYSGAHATYINAALDGSGRWVISARRPDEYAPRPGDLICTSRTPQPVRFDDLPRPHFPAHCDIVVGIDVGQIEVVGGNVSHAVTMKHVPVTPSGLLADAGLVLDPRYPWFVVLRVDDGT